MRIDLLSIFPEFFDVLDLSLIGRAQQDGLLEINRIQPRDFTTDRHRTVDSPPAGGGAGMVMKPEPIAQALEHVLDSSAGPGAGEIDRSESGLSESGPSESGPSESGAQERPVLIIPTPSGELFTQRAAEELAHRQHLVFAAGRFEGIDQRVTEWAQEHFEVRPMSIGDYVLNGGEAAVVVMVEAITRLVPGVIGNPESLDEESHAGDGLLEYPVYTKPAQWRGHEIPQVLLSGDHGKIAAWRREQQELRTRKGRPDIWARYVVAQERESR
ncbi:tRNA (guanosine(37)-N1)-methyltransferase TrmD [Nesterenkonia lacusekhoensis]|uniref:tRNA (guanine-N(1)-)-methyltransferase n=1 Tax=Nesterenkonia lacusekhoensis TaxID=150832 RepID=A0ABS4T0D8_9MICC|nr:tRNA (guanine37-N1)-methyltransferase [Nesterenkonia lacusekhoensis]